MGEARRKRTLLDQERAEQPYCIYCGGRTVGDSVDHMPPRTIFDLRYRPKGLEFLACTACNAGGKKAEQIAGFLSRSFYPTPRSREIDQELRNTFKQMINNHRDVLLEMFPSDEQLANFKHSYPTLQQFMRKDGTRNFYRVHGLAVSRRRGPHLRHRRDVARSWQSASKDESLAATARGARRLLMQEHKGLLLVAQIVQKSHPGVKPAGNLANVGLSRWSHDEAQRDTEFDLASSRRTAER